MTYKTYSNIFDTQIIPVRQRMPTRTLHVYTDKFDLLSSALKAV